ncbi:HD domain-containing protein [Patescibacteria group bacterium]
MKKINRTLAKKLLKRYPVPDGVLGHLEEVKRIALLIGKQLLDHGERLDLDFLEAAAYLHDLGRCEVNYEKYPREKQALHASVGEEILIKEGYPELAAIAGAHSVVVINQEEAEEMGLPKATKLPERVEAKIVCIADKLRGGPPEEAIEFTFNRMWDRYFSKDDRLGQRVKKQTLEFLAELKRKGWDGNY